MGSPSDNVIFFDGDCGFCGRSVRFIMARDPGRRFAFAPLGSAAAEKLLRRSPKRSEDEDLPDTLILLEEGRRFERSTAVLRIARHLQGVWPLLYLLTAVPRPLRDALYNAFARRRHRWFPARSNCPLPGAPDRARFLE